MAKTTALLLILLLAILTVVLISVFSLKADNFAHIAKIIKILVCAVYLMYINLLCIINKFVKNRINKNKTLSESKKITERQFVCLRNLMYENETYKSLALSLCVSESTIKKDMTDLYELFDVSTKSELKKKILNMNEKNRYLLLEKKVIKEL